MQHYELRNMNNLVKSAFELAIRAIEFDDTKEAKETLILCGRCVLYKKNRSGKDISNV